MQAVNFDDWVRWQREGCAMLPAVRICPGEPMPAAWENFADAAGTVLLESAQAGRYSYLCDRPARLLFGSADGADLRSSDGARSIAQLKGRPLDVLERLLKEAKAPALPGWPAMSGGWVGVLGYDLVRTWERLPARAKRERSIPLYAMVEPAEWFIYDHLEKKLGIVVWRRVAEAASSLRQQFEAAEELAQGAHKRWRAGGGQSAAGGIPEAVTIANVKPSFSGEEFERAVGRIQDYIRAGDTYQVNLSLRETRPASVAPARVYESLRRINPSPYMGLLRLPGFSLVCGSPELLVKLVDGEVTSRPIAGTRPRGDVPVEDHAYSAELFASEKERAEHLMLVDLIRNDIGRVADFGTVEVEEFMALERYSHVMHIVSQVRGRLAAGKTWRDVLQSMFPGGTITGCPKIRTMEIIDELEPVGRGFYTGALGWISYGGAMEMNIVIRSMLLQDGLAHVQAGAGIVADSQPERELDEARRKARALWVALEAASGEKPGVQ